MNRLGPWLRIFSFFCALRNAAAFLRSLLLLLPLGILAFLFLCAAAARLFAFWLCCLGFGARFVDLDGLADLGGAVSFLGMSSCRSMFCV